MLNFISSPDSMPVCLWNFFNGSKLVSFLAKNHYSKEIIVFSLLCNYYTECRVDKNWARKKCFKDWHVNENLPRALLHKIKENYCETL